MLHKIMTAIDLTTLYRLKKKRLKNKFTWLLHKYKSAHTPRQEDSNHTPQAMHTQVTNSLTHEQKDLLSLGPKFIITQTVNNNTLFNIETHSCRAAYHLKWLKWITNNNTKTQSTTDDFPVYQLDHPLHPPPKDQELDTKLARLKRRIFDIIKHEQRSVIQNISYKQRCSLKSLKCKDFVYLPIRERSSASYLDTYTTTLHSHT